jgi:V8-like Glu-specific endopeptidase
MFTTRYARRLSVGAGASATALALVLAGTSAAHAASGVSSDTPSQVPGSATSAQPVTGAQFKAKLGGKQVEIEGPGGKPVAATTGGSTTIKRDVVGGTGADISQFPYLVQVIYDLGPDPSTGDEVFQLCGGTLIAPTEVLTAGHCVHNMNAADALVWAGSTENILDVPANQIPSGMGALVQRQWVDPKFAATADGAAANDVAVLSLDFPLSTVTLPLAAPSSTSLYTAGKTATIAGWGVTDPANPQEAPNLQTASVTLASDASCAGAFGSDYVASEMVCTGTGSATPATAQTCNGDSGGPLIENGTLIGVVSYGGAGCAAPYYDVFAKASTFYGPLSDWVETSNGITSDGSTDGLGGLMGVTPAGAVYAYASTGKGGLTKRFPLVTGFGGIWLGQADLELSGIVGLMYRTPNGHLDYLGASPSGDAVDVYEGSGWNIYNMIIPLGNVAGGIGPDLVARDASGKMWLYLGYGNGKFTTRTLISSGWNTYNTIIGDGDFNGDGYADLIARDASGNLYLYQGTGSKASPFKPRVLIGTGFRIYHKMAVVNNYMGDGLAALMGVDASGNLYVYHSTGSSTAPLEKRVLVGTGWNIYSTLF